MNEELPTIEQRIERLECQLILLAESLAQHSHVVHMLARQLRHISNELDIEIPNPRTM
jgi:uncharacterized coiled-coil protein SlyX